ncbi:MAG: transposase, partial [Thermodesulfobacteriota bacterium]|nr:transposase [Thermodesulfobacteriota bacterium]
MDDIRVAGKLREQMVRFSGGLSRGLTKPGVRFVREAVYGIQARQSVMLSEIARSLDERIALKKTETRLSNELGRSGLRECLMENLVALGASRIGEDTLLILDTSDIVKRYARSMEYMARVRDGSTGDIGSGYWTVQVIGAELDEVKVTPLYGHLYSQVAPGFVSENEEMLSAVRLVSRHTEGRGIWVMDRGADRRRLYYPLLDHGLRFITRLKGDRELICGGRSVLAVDVAGRCPTLYAERVVRDERGKERVYQIEYGYRRVKLPGRREKLTLVVVKGFGEEPMMLLTNVDVRRTRRSCSFVVWSYIRRWQIEDTIRCVKQSYDVENVRLLSYERLQNMIALVECAMYFAAVYLGDRMRVRILAEHALRAARRLFGIPDFRYYALADGIGALLTTLKRPFMARAAPEMRSLQALLLD